MKVTKLVTGILSCVLFCFITFQSCAAGTYNALEENGEVSGSAGIITAILILAAGIVSIATHKGSKGKGTIAGIILYAIAGLFGVVLHGSFSDLMIWGIYAWILVAVLIIFQIKGKKANEVVDKKENVK